MTYMDIKNASARWNIPERRIAMLCKAGRIPGAVKEGKYWKIPFDAKMPVDGRKKRMDIMEAISKTKLPLPIGVSDYVELVENYYYVDKTLMIKEFLDARPKVSLFTRPRRFGKTLAMDMIKTFFEISDKDNSVYFKDKKIWACGERYQNECGKYPVIAISFKDIKYDTWEETFEAIKSVVAGEFRRHIYLLDSDKCNEFDKRYFRCIMEGDITAVSLSIALKNLSYMLKVHHDKAAIVIIDEYDTPIQKGYVEGYYDEIVGFMRNLMSGALKDNSDLAFGFMTGILRVAKESIFSGLNNLTIQSVMEEKYSEFFGFTADEVRAMCSYYCVEDKYEEISEWYDGYVFGDKEIYNPWSVINYFSEKYLARAYWQSTGDNSIIRQIVLESDDEMAENLRRLMQGETISTYVDTAVIYPEIKNNPTTIYSFLIAAGYLKTIKKEYWPDGNSVCDVAIPNKEIFYVYEKEILSALSDVISHPTAIAIQQAILRGDMVKLQEQLQKLLINTISSYDYAKESFYQGLMLGICAIMNNLYRVESNRESGLGRYDIQLKPIRKNMPGILIELKVLKGDVKEESIESELDKKASLALEQIEKMHYDINMKEEGIRGFLKIGVAFYKKHVRVKSVVE